MLDRRASAARLSVRRQSVSECAKMPNLFELLASTTSDEEASDDSVSLYENIGLVAALLLTLVFNKDVPEAKVLIQTNGLTLETTQTLIDMMTAAMYLSAFCCLYTIWEALAMVTTLQHLPKAKTFEYLAQVPSKALQIPRYLKKASIVFFLMGAICHVLVNSSAWVRIVVMCFTILLAAYRMYTTMFIHRPLLHNLLHDVRDSVCRSATNTSVELLHALAEAGIDQKMAAKLHEEDVTLDLLKGGLITVDHLCDKIGLSLGQAVKLLHHTQSANDFHVLPVHVLPVTASADLNESKDINYDGFELPHKPAEIVNFSNQFDAELVDPGPDFSSSPLSESVHADVDDDMPIDVTKSFQTLGAHVTTQPCESFSMATPPVSPRGLAHPEPSTVLPCGLAPSEPLTADVSKSVKPPSASPPTDHLVSKRRRTKVTSSQSSRPSVHLRTLHELRMTLTSKGIPWSLSDTNTQLAEKVRRHVT